MFSGIVEKTVPVIAVADGPGFRRLTLGGDWPDLRDGQSVAVNGCCLTVAEVSPGAVGFDVIKETLARTNLGLLSRGDHVNVERSLRIGQPLDGHFVQGHIDGIAPLLHRHESPGEIRLRVRAPDALAKYLSPKGSLTLDGVSLTIAAIEGAVFEVALIPTTVRLTTLTNQPVGWTYNLEADILTKTIVSYLERTHAT